MNQPKTVTPTPVWRVSAWCAAALAAVGTLLGVILHCAALLVCGGILAVLATAFWLVWTCLRITFSGTQWCCRRWIFRRKTYQIIDLRGITFGTATGGYTLHLTHGRIRVGPCAANGAEFRAWAEKGYLRAKQTHLPYEPLRLFHNNVQNPWTFLISGCIICTLLLALAVGMTLSNTPLHEVPDLTRYEIVLTSVEAKGDRWYLTADGLEFLMPCSEAAKHLQDYVGRTLVSQAEENWLWAATDAAGRTLITPQETLQAMQRMERNSLWGVWLIAAFAVLVFAAGCYVLDHATEYPRLAALLVRPEKRNFSVDWFGTKK